GGYEQSLGPKIPFPFHDSAEKVLILAMEANCVICKGPHLLVSRLERRGDVLDDVDEDGIPPEIPGLILHADGNPAPAGKARMDSHNIPSTPIRRQRLP